MNRKYIGIPVALIFMVAFVAISLLINQSLHGTTWFLFSSGLRIVFGIAILYVSWRIYGKTIPEILNLKNSRMDGIIEVRPNISTHPAFGTAMKEAVAAGVQVLFLPCHVEPDQLLVAQ